MPKDRLIELQDKVLETMEYFLVSLENENKTLKETLKKLTEDNQQLISQLNAKAAERLNTGTSSAGHIQRPVENISATRELSDPLKEKIDDNNTTDESG